MNQEKALVGAFSVIAKPNVEPMDRFTALEATEKILGVLGHHSYQRSITISHSSARPSPAISSDAKIQIQSDSDTRLKRPRRSNGL